MDKLTFKFGNSSQLAGATINEGDFIALNESINKEGATELDAKLGSFLRGNKIIGTTKSSELVTTEDITVVGLDGKLGAGIENNTVIPAGTSLQDFLKMMLCKTLYPKVATKPSLGNLTLTSNLSGCKIIGSKVSVPGARVTANHGSFNSSWEGNPSQPATGSAVVAGSLKITPTVNSGFENYSAEAVSGDGDSLTLLSKSDIVVSLGTNKITFVGSGEYTAPSNNPITNLGDETTKTSESAAEGSATFEAGDYVAKSNSVSVTGVYPVYHNIVSGVYASAASTQFGAQSEAVFELKEVPTEIESNPLIIEFPASKNVSNFELKDPSGKWAKFAGNYSVESETFMKTINGTEYEYKRFKTDGTNGAGNTYRITFDSTLDK